MDKDIKETNQQKFYKEVKRISNGKWWIEQYLISGYTSRSSKKRIKLNG